MNQQDKIRYFPDKNIIIMEIKPKRNKTYPVSVYNDDNELIPLQNYWLKYDNDKMILYIKEGENIKNIYRENIENIENVEHYAKEQEKFDKTILSFLYKKCPDLLELEDLFLYNIPNKKIQNKNKKLSEKLPSIKALENIKLSRGKDIIIKGRVQSGKTNFMICSAIKYMYCYPCMSSIIILRNISGDELQFERRIDEFLLYLNKNLEELKIDRQVYIKIMNDDIDNKSMVEAMNCTTPQIFVLLGNNSKIRKINNKIKQCKNRYYALFIDESDSNESGDSDRVQEINILKDNAKIVYHISATVMDNALSQNIQKGGIYMMKNPENYHGLDANHHFLLEDSDALPSNKKTDIPWKKDSNLIKWLDFFNKTEPYYEPWICAKHPRHCLVSIGTSTKPQKLLFRYIAKNYDIAVILYNGEGIDLYHSKLASIKNIHIKCGKKAYYSKKTTWCNNAHSFTKKVSISDVIQWLKNNGGVSKFPRIITLSGKLAGRGISFVSADYGMYIDSVRKNKLCMNWIGWRLTEMYMMVSKNTSQPNLMQMAGRLCCIVYDNIPTTIYCTQKVFDDILKAYQSQEELISRAIMTQEKYTDMFFKEAVMQLKIRKEKISKRPLTISSEKRLPKCNLVKDDSDQPGAFNMNLYKPQFVTINNISQNIVDENIPGDISTSEELLAVKNAYKRGNGKVSKIINYYVSHNFEPIDTNKIHIILNNDKVTIANFTRWDLSHSRYNIIEKQKDGNYILRDEIIKYLKL